MHVNFFSVLHQFYRLMWAIRLTKVVKIDLYIYIYCVLIIKYLQIKHYLILAKIVKKLLRLIENFISFPFRYKGKFCECSDHSCERGADNELCSGPLRGVCDCGKCNCKSGWTGSVCDCSTSKAECLSNDQVSYEFTYLCWTNC